MEAFMSEPRDVQCTECGVKFTVEGATFTDDGLTNAFCPTCERLVVVIDETANEEFPENHVPDLL